MFSKHDFNYKWSKIFTSKIFDDKSDIILSTSEQDELLNDITRIEDTSSAILPRGEDDYESLMQQHWSKDDSDDEDNIDEEQ